MYSRVVTLLGILAVIWTGTAHAQVPPVISGPKRAAQRAVDAENRQLHEQTGQQIQSKHAAPPAATPQPAGQPARGAAPAGKAGSAKTAAKPTMPNGASTKVGKDSVESTVVMREVYQFEGDARRDPFRSLLTQGELRPAITDLRLMGILYDPRGRRSIAVMRDLGPTHTQYRVTTGMLIGRMRVSEIKPKSVVFTIEEFGFSRQDSLVLGDTTKVRAR